MNDIIKKYYNIEECKSFKITDKCLLSSDKIMEKYNDYMAIKDNIHIGSLSKFEYLQIGDTLKLKKKNDYYLFYYKNKDRTSLDTYNSILSLSKLKWLVQTRITYANTIQYRPRNIFYISLGYNMKIREKYELLKKNQPEINSFIRILLNNDYSNINQYEYKIYDSQKNYNDYIKDRDLNLDQLKNKKEYNSMKFHTPFINNKIVSTINDYLIKIDLLFCNNIIRKRDSTANIKRKIIYVIYIGLQLLLKGGSLVIQLDMRLYKNNKKYLIDVLNILNIYFDDVKFFINNLERGYLGGTLLVIANKFNNKEDIQIVDKYIKSRYKMDLSKHYPTYNNNITNSLGNVFTYLMNMMNTLQKVSDYNKTLTIAGKKKLTDILDKPRYKIAQDIVKKYKISPAIDSRYYSPLLSHIREYKPGNILLYGNILKNIKDAIIIGNKYNFNKNNIYEFESILNMNITFDFIYMNFNCKDNGKFILSYIMKILNPDAYILFKQECKYLKDYKQLKRSKTFTIDGSKYLLYNLSPVEDVFDSYNNSPISNI